MASNRRYAGRIIHLLGRVMYSLLMIAIITYAVILVAMTLLQRKILYLPMVAEHYPADSLHEVDVVTLHTVDGETLIAWHKAARDGYPTLIYFHGNAGNLHDRVGKFRQFTDEGFGLFAVGYRGYGSSTGSPTEQGLYIDARTAIDWAVANHIPLTRQIFYGESLGSGVAVQMATEFTPAAVVLEAPYTSVVDRGFEKYPFLPVSLVLRDRFESIRKIGRVSAPLLIIHGDQDVVIPIHHGRKLLAAAHEPKEGIFLPGIGHTDFPLDELAGYVRDFARRHHLIGE